MIDTHSHIFEQEFDEDIEAVIARAQSVGVEKILLPNIDVESIERLKTLSQKYPHYCFPMMGLHPTSVKEDYKEQLAVIRNELTTNKYVAIGEVGLDFYWDRTFEREQIEVFETQIEWSLEMQLPLSVHVRESGEETLCLLQKYAGKGLRAVIHSFTGDENMAKKFLTLGEDVYLGVNGIITFKKSESLRAVLKQVVPLNKIVIETDSPYLSPVPYRGRRNESAYVVEVLRKLSEIYEKTVDEVEKITNNNAKMLFFT